MKRVNRIVRIFVSSTFQDMELERNVLQHDVVPYMQKWCGERGWQFEVVDLRWGISEEASRAHRTMSICLEELANCQRLSPKPNLLLLIGERYGWMPLPEHLTQKVAEAILTVANSKERKLFNKLYHLNNNIIPSSYELITDVNLAEEIQIREIMVRYYHQTDDDNFYHQYLVSATEQEIQQGLLSNTEAFHHVIVYTRTLTALPQKEKATFIDTDHIDEIELLRQRVKQVVSEENRIEREVQYAEYKCKEYEEWFANEICQHIKSIIEEEISSHNLDDYKEEHLRQQHVLETKSKEYLNRNNEVKTITQTLDESNSNKLCVVHGASGIGLTTFAAQICKELIYKDFQPTIFRFIGIGNLSSSGLSLLRTLLHEVGVNYDDSESVFDLIVKWRVFLEEYHKKIFIILDGLDKLDSNDWFIRLQWLPYPLPKWLHIILTLSDDCRISGLKRHVYKEFRLSELSDEILLASFIQELSQYNHKISKQQTNLVRKIFNNIRTPLVKQPLLSLSSQWTDSDIPQLECTRLQELMDVYLNELVTSSFHNERFLGIVLSLLCFCRHGIAEHEILEIAASDNIFYSFLQEHTHHKIVESGPPKIPFIYWSRLHHDIDVFLALRQNSKNVTYIIANKIILKCIESWLKKKFHDIQHKVTMLACDYFKKNEGPRSFDELPFLLESLGDETQLQKLIISDKFMSGKCYSGMIDDLMSDYESFIRKHPNNPMAPNVKLRMLFITEYRNTITTYACYGGDIVISLWKQYREKTNHKDVKATDKHRIDQTMFVSGRIVIAAYNDKNIAYCKRAPRDTYDKYLECFIIERSSGLVSDFTLIPFGWNAPHIEEAILSEDGNKLLLLSTESESFIIWDRKTGEVLSGRKENLEHMTMLPDGSIYYIAGNEIRTFNDEVVCELNSKLCSSLFSCEEKRIYYDFLTNSLYVIVYDSFFYMAYDINTHHTETRELPRRIQCIISYDKATSCLLYRRCNEKTIYKHFLRNNINEVIQYEPQEFLAEKQASIVGEKWFTYVDRISNNIVCHNLVSKETILSDIPCDAQYISSFNNSYYYLSYGCYELREWLLKA